MTMRTETTRAPRGTNGNGAPVAATRATVTDSYQECARYVMRRVVPLYRANALAIDAATCAAITATLYIERSRMGQ